jgi:restriction endonuclease Mrr
MAILDDLSGFEFEDLVEDVFRTLGYENVRQAKRTADEGRDVLMEEVVDGTRRGVVVECKHTATVGRPVVQKLHSAVSTFEFDGPTRGMVVTTGRFTGPAEEYAQRLRENGDPHPVELVDGRDLREIADEIGLDLYNGRIEILCDETLRPHDPATPDATPVVEAFRDVDNVDASDLPEPFSAVTFRPVVTITADVDAVFETSVGVIHRIDDRTRFLVHARRDGPDVLDERLARLVAENAHATVDLDEERIGDVFDHVEQRRFGQTQTEYKEWAVDRLRESHTTTVTYEGDNNVTYTKTCEPTRSDVSVRSIDPVYLPDVRQTTTVQSYTYPYQYYAAGPSRVTVEDGIHQCVHCETSGAGESYTFCANCGSINCGSHVETERLEGDPVCTGCAVVERFALKKKYFYDEANLEAFREEYAEMPVYRKAMENPFLAGGGLVAVLLVLVGLSAAVGGI